MFTLKTLQQRQIGKQSQDESGFNPAGLKDFGLASLNAPQGQIPQHSPTSREDVDQFIGDSVGDSLGASTPNKPAQSSLGQFADMVMGNRQGTTNQQQGTNWLDFFHSMIGGQNGAG